LNKNSNRRILVAILGLAVAAIAISLFAHWQSRFPGDLQLELFLQSLGGKGLLSLMEWASYLMEGWRAGIIIIAGAIVTWRYVGKLEGGLVVVAGLVSLLDSPIKFMVDRPRPTSALVQVFAVEHDSGFPSGHAMFVVLVLGFLVYLAVIYLRRRNLSVLTFAFLLALILLTGVSRVYLGVHWPSDVLGGYLIGATLLLALIYLNRGWIPCFKGRYVYQRNKGQIKKEAIKY
jgi:membrane-associated phospholipid phosphatase